MISDRKDAIFNGKKPLMTCVTSAIVQFATMALVTIKTTGLSIGQLIDVVQIILRKTNSAFVVENIKKGSESLVSSNGKNRNFSTIEIPITRVTV